jgi:hypothetical protein
VRLRSQFCCDLTYGYFYKNISHLNSKIGAIER